MLSKWQQSMSMELAHSLNPSYSEASGSMFLDTVSILFVLSIIGHPHPPRLITVTPVNSTTVNVSWSEVQCFNGSGAVTHYLVQYQSMCGGAVQNVTTDGTVQTISGLTPNVAEYSFLVAAVGTTLNIGPFSNPVSTSLLGELCN